ncbi:MAG TPA: mismatch-specific DNA-glycosylase [Chthonomonas sp.]|jgi:TDG/mug DNA glycosylase family protein|uniref:mismatch-specific DNA-glycosylase n=1 Tax=Chthonomonas sp. TaxID=2282153 RepID=UPI002B4AC1B6|nr:mismatch-specific DNA-glycosylase [Chthonomonas sp.]HLH80828.1 mismatch-specific DNA-glycosylase [Chthonomonas sp.]
MEERAPLLPDILVPGLDVVFVGAAPSLWAAQVGHYYAGPRNRFWLLLYQAGFTPRLLQPEEDVTLPCYGIGLVALFHHIASNANHLLPEPAPALREQLIERLIEAAPRWVCYNGKDVYRMVTGKECRRWGEQKERLGPARTFVVISSSGRADGWGHERLALYKELYDCVYPTRCS